MHASHEPTIPTTETDPVRKSRPAGDEDLDYEEPQEAEEPEEEPPPTEYPGGGDGYRRWGCRGTAASGSAGD
jgi:hypothetical protein